MRACDCFWVFAVTLRKWNLYGWHLPHSLVCLSACEWKMEWVLRWVLTRSFHLRASLLTTKFSSCLLQVWTDFILTCAYTNRIRTDSFIQDPDAFNSNHLWIKSYNACSLLQNETRRKMKNNLYVALRDNKFIQKVSREAEIHRPKKVGKVVKGACWLDRIPH